MRRNAFEQTINHQNPDHLILDLGGCPLSGMDGNAAKKLSDLLGYRGYETLMLWTRRADFKVSRH